MNRFKSLLLRFKYLAIGTILGGLMLAGTNTEILTEVAAALGTNSAIRQILHIGDDDGIEAEEHTVRDIDGTASALDVGTLSVTIDGDFDITGSMDWLQFEPGLSAPSWSEGLIFYDDIEKTLAVYNNESDVTLQLGQEIYLRVTNNTGVQIANGSLVYVKSAIGNRPTIELARANSPSTCGVIAITTHDIDDNATGFVTTLGLVRGLDTSGDTAGTFLYLSPDVAGEWTSTPPLSPNFRISIGVVTRSNPEEGAVMVILGPTDVCGHMIIQSLCINDSLNVTGEFRLIDGSNYVGFDAPTLSANQIWILPDADGNRGDVLATDGSDTLSWSSNASEKSWGFRSPSGASGLNHYGGFYEHATSDNDFSPSANFGTANAAKGAHFYVVLGAETVDSLTITVTGTSITDAGVRTTSDTETIGIPTATAVNSYFETSKKWNGTVAVEATSGTAKTCNYGYAKYWDSNNSDYTIAGIEATWVGGANDATPNIGLRHHKATGWTFNVGDEADPPAYVADMASDYSTEVQVVNGEDGAWKRTNLDEDVNGADSEGTIIEVFTSANRAFILGTVILRVVPQ